MYSAAEGARIRRLEREREEDKNRIEALKKEKASKASGFREWQVGTHEKLEAAFKTETVGLVTKQEYVTKKATIQARLEEEASKRKREDETRAEAERNRKKALLQKQRQAAKLSFAEDVEDGDEEECDDELGHAREAPRLKKDDGVRTDFLPDVERDRQKADQARSRAGTAGKGEVAEHAPRPQTSITDGGQDHARSKAG